MSSAKYVSEGLSGDDRGQNRKGQRRYPSALFRHIYRIKALKIRNRGYLVYQLFDGALRGARKVGHRRGSASSSRHPHPVSSRAYREFFFSSSRGITALAHIWFQMCSGNTTHWAPKKEAVAKAGGHRTRKATPYGFWGWTILCTFPQYFLMAKWNRNHRSMRR